MTETVATRARFVCDMVVQTARLMVGVPDYQTYVAHRQATHPDLPMMTYVEFSGSTTSAACAASMPCSPAFITASQVRLDDQCERCPLT